MTARRRRVAESRRPKPTHSTKPSGVLKLVSDVTALTAVITALLVYVGRTRNRPYYGFFGINQGILSPSVFTIADRLIIYAIRQPGVLGWRTWINAGLAIIGLGMSIFGLLSAVDVTAGLGIRPLVAAVTLAVGAVLTLRFGPATLSRFTDIDPFGRVSNLMVYAALALALFWGATLYAQDLGRQAAQATDTDPSTLPVVTVFSDDYLDLPGTLVKASVTPGPGGSQHYRYAGLSLLTYSNGRWFLITGRYSDSYRSSVVVLPDSGAIRVEIAANQ